MASHQDQKSPMEEPTVSKQSNNTCDNSNLETDEVDIESNENDIETNESDIETNESDIETNESDLDSDDCNSGSECEEEMERTDWEMEYLEYERQFQKYYDDGRVEAMEEAYLEGEEDAGSVGDEEMEAEETNKAPENIPDLLNLNDAELHFKWSPIGSFKMESEPFLARQGTNFNPNSPLEAFRYFWDDTILKYIVDETNRNVVGTESFKDWIDTDSDEILLLFSFYMSLGLVSLPTIEEYFSGDRFLNEIEFFKQFKKVISKERFLSLEWALFANYPLITPSETFFNEYVLDYINEKFQTAYVPGRDVYIDESQKLSNGNFKYLLPNTTVMKSFVLSESVTEYMFSLIVYAEKDLPSRPSLQSTKIVKKIITPLLSKGYRVFLDHRMNSPILARFLKKNRTDCVGTVAINQDLPNTKQAEIPKGNYIAQQTDDIVVITYQDKKRITLISTCHNIEIEKAKYGALFRPNVINDYNKNMGKVDLDERFQYLKPYLEETKRKDWYKTLFKQCLNASINNARVIYNASTGKNVSLRRFRADLLKELIQVIRPGMFPKY